MFSIFQMVGAAASARILSPDDGPAVEILNGDGGGPFVFACEHASNRIPRSLGSLGLTPAGLSSHIAWDPGALEVARHLSGIVDGPLVAPRISRLVFDCNRPPSAPDGIVEVSEDQPIPGNRGLAEAEVQARVAEVYEPFHDALREVLRARLDRRRPPMLVTIHSFTPVFLGRSREVELGVLYDLDTRLADALMKHAAAVTGLEVRRNDPYGPADGVTHTLKQHGIRNGLLNAMLEIRNDLIADEAASRRMADMLAELLGRVSDENGSPSASSHQRRGPK